MTKTYDPVNDAKISKADIHEYVNTKTKFTNEQMLNVQT